MTLTRPKPRPPKPPRLPRNPNKTSSRRTSKVWLVVNSAFGWAAIIYGIHQNLDAVAVSGFSFITVTYGLYVGIGHLDYRQLVMSMLRHQPSPTTGAGTAAATTEIVDPPTD